MDRHERAALAKAALWSALAGVAHVLSTWLSPGFYPHWYFALGAASFALMLPAIASLHARHAAVRASGAVLGTIAGTAAVVFGFAATAQPAFAPAAAFAFGMWWWTIGKMWSETAALPRALGWITMALAIAAFASVGAYAITGESVGEIATRWPIGAWLVVVAVVFWREASSMAP